MSLISVLKTKCNKNLFTTPSHGGKYVLMHKFRQWYRNDISEVDAYNPQEALRIAEAGAALIYGVRSTHFLTNGSSSGIIAAVLACCKKSDKILIWDNAHKCHKNAAFLAGANIIEYTLPFNEEWGIYEGLTAKRTEELIIKHAPKAIIVTSPSYEGIVSEVEKISVVCKKHQVIFIADEAHGALYPFSDKLPQSSVNYADFTVQSLHKTAGGINPTALLHNNTEFDAAKALGLINTTSPSYPMLATIEANIKFLNSKKGRFAIDKLCSDIESIKSYLTNIQFYGDDVTKILIKKDGYSGFELSNLLYDRFGIEDERTNEKSTMLLTGIGTDYKKLMILKKLKKI